MIDLQRLTHDEVVSFLDENVEVRLSHMQYNSDGAMSSIYGDKYIITVGADTKVISLMGIEEQLNTIHIMLSDILPEGKPLFQVIIGNSNFMLYRLPFKLDALARVYIRRKTRDYNTG